MIVCYVILVNRPFETEIAGIKLFFGDAANLLI